MTTENTQSTEPKETTENTQSSKPTENTQSSKPTENTQSSKPTENTQSSKPTENTQSSKPRESSGSRDTIFIGKKPLMAYVTSTLIQLANLPAVHIKARGMSIGRAVDVAQIIARKTESAGYMIGEIKIDSEALESQDGRTRNVSTIEIEVKRTKS
jgi:DNA-binding protein